MRALTGVCVIIDGVREDNKDCIYGKKRAILGKIAKLDSFYAQKFGKDMKIQVWKTKRGNDFAGQ